MFPPVDNTEIARPLNGKGFKAKAGRIGKTIMIMMRQESCINEIYFWRINANGISRNKV